MMASTSAAMGHSGMAMGGCKISMLWNWYTVDACFISSHWRVTSKGNFAGSCFGVVCLVILLEGLRRGQREFDAYLVKQYRNGNIVGGYPWCLRVIGRWFARGFSWVRSKASSLISKSTSCLPLRRDVERNASNQIRNNSTISKESDSQGPAKPQHLVPSTLQQVVRALFHMLQFAVAYFIMLMAMYYNGFIILSIVIGAFLGAFIFSWEVIHITDACVFP
ncbi:MAG: hypothetical protein Q9208_003404 [Pyrenodesmia sp. 3 TL-2023]